MKKKILIVFTVVALSVLVVLVIREQAFAPSGSNTTQPVSVNTQAAEPVTAVEFNKNTYSTSDPASQWVIINKVTALPSSYVPADLIQPQLGGNLRQPAANALNQLVTAAKNDGIYLGMLSSYRSYATQVSTYNGYVAKDGQATADTYSARPGHSEHQTGWAADLGNGTCNLDTCFGDTLGGKWLAAHAHEFGFVIRYPAGKQAITGYQYEPWHIRYVGHELAGELKKTGQTMEEFFGVVPQKQPY